MVTIVIGVVLGHMTATVASIVVSRLYSVIVTSSGSVSVAVAIATIIRTATIIGSATINVASKGAMASVVAAFNIDCIGCGGDNCER